MISMLFTPQRDIIKIFCEGSLCCNSHSITSTPGSCRCSGCTYGTSEAVRIGIFFPEIRREWLLIQTAMWFSIQKSTLTRLLQSSLLAANQTWRSSVISTDSAAAPPPSPLWSQTQKTLQRKPAARVASVCVCVFVGVHDWIWACCADCS